MCSTLRMLTHGLFKPKPSALRNYSGKDILLYVQGEFGPYLVANIGKEGHATWYMGTGNPFTTEWDPYTPTIRNLPPPDGVSLFIVDEGLVEAGRVLGRTDLVSADFSKDGAVFGSEGDLLGTTMFLSPTGQLTATRGTTMV